MSKTKIEYLDYCWNFYPGCLNGCSYCWAHNRVTRFNKGDFTPKLRLELLLEPLKWKKPSRIGVCFTGDLFGDWVDPNKLLSRWEEGEYVFYHIQELRKLREIVFYVIGLCPQHTFIFLTKQPQNLIKWSPFPENCWVGASATNQTMHNRAIACLSGIKASVKFISYEPLLSEIDFSGAYDLSELQWAICGQQTPVKEATMPKLGWVEEVVGATGKASIPVFLKDNLISCVGQYEFALKDGKYRQEFPYGGKNDS